MTLVKVKPLQSCWFDYISKARAMRMTFSLSCLPDILLTSMFGGEGVSPTRRTSLGASLRLLLPRTGAAPTLTERLHVADLEAAAARPSSAHTTCPPACPSVPPSLVSIRR